MKRIIIFSVISALITILLTITFFNFIQKDKTGEEISDVTSIRKAMAMEYLKDKYENVEFVIDDYFFEPETESFKLSVHDISDTKFEVSYKKMESSGFYEFQDDYRIKSIVSKFDSLCYKYFKTLFNTTTYSHGKDRYINIYEFETHTSIYGSLYFQTISLNEVRDILNNFCYPIIEYDPEIYMDIKLECENKEDYKINIADAEYDRETEEYLAKKAEVYKYSPTIEKWEKVIDGRKIYKEDVINSVK